MQPNHDVVVVPVFVSFKTTQNRFQKLGKSHADLQRQVGMALDKFLAGFLPMCWFLATMCTRQALVLFEYQKTVLTVFPLRCNCKRF
jgi:hypothetical protein